MISSRDFTIRQAPLITAIRACISGMSLLKIGLCACAASMLDVPSFAAGTESVGRDRVITIHKTLWKIYRQQQNLDAFLREATLLESLTKDPEILQVTGNELMLARRYKEAMPYFKRARELGENSDNLGQDPTTRGTGTRPAPTKLANVEAQMSINAESFNKQLTKMWSNYNFKNSAIQISFLTDNWLTCAR